MTLLLLWLTAANWLNLAAVGELASLRGRGACDKLKGERAVTAALS